MLEPMLTPVLADISYNLVLIASLFVRLIGLLLVFASHNT